MIARAIVLVGTLALSGCAGFQASNTEANFLCEAQLGTPCTTMAEADGGGHGAVTSLKEARTDSQNASLSQDPLLGGKSVSKEGVLNVSGMRDGGTPYWAGNYRVPERLGTLWVAPYLDENGLLHEATFVHFVINEARWGNRGR